MLRLTTTLVLLIALTFCVAGCKKSEVNDDTTATLEESVLMEGLTIKDVVVGDGDVAAKGDLCTVHYTGWVLVDGVKAPEPFDSSVARGEPISFPVGVGQLIRGWDEGIPGMKVGGKRELTIAPELGYGAMDRPNIPANSTLFFEVELLEIPRVKIEDTLIGTGAVVESGDVVEVHYTGWLWTDGVRGEKFDSSLDRGQTASFPIGVGRVIPGWDQGIPGMKIGGKRILTIPASLGYGARGAGDVIPPDSDLLFEVELVGIQGK
jgi:peptidylprolyl isomerase